jgi:hypothetical protein
MSNRENRHGGGEEQRRNSERYKDLVGNGNGIIEGSGTVSGLNENINRLMDTSPRFQAALRAAYSRFCTPSPHSAIPPEHLLSSLQFLVQVRRVFPSALTFFFFSFQKRLCFQANALPLAETE